MRFLDAVRVNVLLAGVSDDNSRFRLANEIRRLDGELERTPDFETLPSSLR